MFAVLRVDPAGHQVEIRRTTDGKRARIPLTAATVLWMREQPRTNGRFAVLSFLTASEPPPARLFVCLTDGAVPWPDWHPEAPPAVRPLALQAWESLPQAGDAAACARLLSGATHAARSRDASIAADLGQRCDRIVQEGRDPEYGDGLDHYTRVRVKAAFLRMNERVLTDRLSEVRKVLAELLPRARVAEPDWGASWTCPDAIAVAPSGDAVSDPNALRVPQVSDYELPA